MKRLVALLGIALVLVGVRLYDGGLLRFAPQGTLTVFGETEYHPQMFIPTGGDCYRIDLVGSKHVDKILDGSLATVQFTEMDGKLIYAYSPRIPRVEWVHGKRVNIMIYAEGDKVAAGVPILKGSY